MTQEQHHNARSLEDSAIREDSGGPSSAVRSQPSYGLGITTMDSSWVKVHRKLMDHWLYTNPAYTNIWLAILFGTNYKPSKVLIEGKLITIERGEILTSMRTLANNSHTSVKAVRNFLKLAEQDEMILVKKGTRATHLKVLKYEELQETQSRSGHTEGTPRAQQGHTEGTIIRKKESKKGRKGEEKTLDSAHVRSLRPTVDEASSYFQELGMPSSEAQRFVDYYTANGWKVGKNPMKDWKAAARNWRKNYTDKQAAQQPMQARTAPVGMPAQVTEIYNRPKMDAEAVEALKAQYLSKVTHDE